jgi:hypothetical protein
MNMRILIPLTAAVVLTGCATLTGKTEVTGDDFPSAGLELAYQLASGLDYSTTVNIARRPDCYREVGFPTRQILGEHPSVSGVKAYWALTGVAHIAVSAWLDREVEATDEDAWRAVRIAWHVISMVSAAESTHRYLENTKIGLRPFGTGADPTCGN